MSSLGIAIVFDFVALLLIAVMIVLKQLLGAQVEVWALNALTMILLVTVVGLAGVFVVFPRVVRMLAERMDTSSPKNWWQKLVAWSEQFAHSIEQVKKSGRLVSVTLMSLVIRILKYTGMYLLFMAVALPSFTQLAQLPVEQVIGALVGGEVGASLPIPTFMSFGAYEAGTALVFKLLGVANQAEAFVTMLCVHIWSQLMDYSIGGAFLLLFIVFHRNAKILRASPASTGSSATWRTWLVYAASGLVLVGAAAFLAYQVWAASKLGSIAPPSSGASVVEEMPSGNETAEAINGFVVFSSNRDGNHDIFKLELADRSLTKLTQHPHTETYPRISPDGSKVVFARAHQTWVSQRNTSAWDVWVLELESGKEWRVGQNGTAPHWVDNQRISYVVKAQKVVLVDVESLAREPVFTVAGHPNMPTDAQIYNARFNPLNEQLTLTARQSHIPLSTGAWGTALVDGDSVSGILNGCELAWNSNYNGLFQVEPNSPNSAVRIVRIDPITGEASLMIDLAGEFNHEYWPKDSNDGRYIVFGASRGPQDHEHDTKDYELFLWQVGSDPTQAIRLTFHTGNDNWPDIHIRQ